MLRIASNKIFAPTLLKTAGAHGLVVPYHHDPIVDFDRGVPTEQVRELVPEERKWEFWATSQAFYRMTPFAAVGFAFVPLGESWVIERAGKYSRVLNAGTGFMLPFIDTIKVVKPAVTTLAGVLARNISTKNGSTVDAYAVVYYNIVDSAVSHYYVSPETSQKDSEYELPKQASRLLSKAVADLEVASSGLTTSQKSTLNGSIMTGLKKFGSDWGIEITSVEVRDAYSTELNVPDKIRAYDSPPIDLDSPGHNLSNDYWADVLCPPYFEKKRFGITKIPHTPASVTLEWAVPSPPDFHHFNHVPKLCVSEAEANAGKQKIAAKAH